MKKLFIIVTGIILTGIMSPSDARAIPAFARKYGQNCMMCHTGFARLNDYGQRFRDNGYQIPGQQGKEQTVFDGSLPLSMRLSFGHSTYSTEDGTASSFGLYGLDLLAAGVLHKNISFLLIYTPRIDEPADIFSGPNSNNSNPSQLASLESANLVFSNLVKDALSLRIGRFEPAYHVFSSKRSYYLFQPYEIYNLTTPNNTYVFDDNQIGIEATGHFKFGLKYAAGMISGNGANPDNNSYKDAYLNVTQTIGKGDGQTAGQRVGLFGYYGWQPTTPGNVQGSLGQTDGQDNKPFYRIGATGGFNYKSLSLQVMYMTGADDKAFDTIGDAEKYTYNGGFAELIYSGLLNNRINASVMYNWVQPDEPGYDINAYSAMVRYYLGSWKAVNVAIHGEYTHRITKMYSADFKENMFAVALDFAF